MKTVGIEIQRRQIGIAWVGVPDHWGHGRIHAEANACIDAIREAADEQTPIDWGEVYSTQYFLSAVIGSGDHADFPPDYEFPDEAPPPVADHKQLGLWEGA